MPRLLCVQPQRQRHQGACRWQAPATLRPLALPCPCSVLSQISRALGSDAMYCADTGLCNEQVPLNEHGAQHWGGALIWVALAVG